MKKGFVVLAALIASFLPMLVKAQTFFSTTEYGVMLGASQYFGDLNDNHGFHYMRPVAGAFMRYHFNPYISIRGSVSYTKLGYDDKFSDNAYNKERNLSFRSDIVEGAVQAEFNFFRFATGEEGSRWTPYLTGGIGAFYYNPYADFDGHKYYLRRLGTEGQNADHPERKYSTVSMCFPVGAGFKYWLRPGVNLGFEVADRLTLTDYIDDVSTTYVGADKFPTDPVNPNPAYYLQDPSVLSNPNDPLGRAGKQRGNSATKDQYMYFIFNVSFQLKVYKCPGYMKHGTTVM
ncbi:DUF6089 family protein [Chitinophagaceae bacterium MMS25-I14]